MTHTPELDQTFPNPGQKTRSFRSFLARVFAAPFQSRAVLGAFLFSIAGLAFNRWAWPVLNNTDWYLLLYPVDYVMYFGFLLFAGATARWCQKSAKGEPLPTPLFFFVLVAVNSVLPLVVDEVSAGLTDTMQKLWFSAAVKFPALLVSTLFLAFSVSTSQPLTTLRTGTLVFLKNFHWFLLLSFALTLFELPFSYGIFLWPGLTADDLRVFSDFKKIFSSYLSDLTQVALVLALLDKRSRTAP